MQALIHFGMGRANIEDLQGAGPTSAERNWGGARVSALRASHYLTLAQCVGLLTATAHAEKIGLPFNRHWTIHYENAGIPEAGAARFIRSLLKLATDYARRNMGQLAAVWCRESGKGRGGHVHILLHLPAHLSLSGRTRRWVRLAGGKYRKGVSKVKSIARSLKAAGQGSPHYHRNAAIVLAYVMKGADLGAANALRLHRYGIGGLILGKRCGWTQNIGKASQIRMAKNQQPI